MLVGLYIMEATKRESHNALMLGKPCGGSTCWVFDNLMPMHARILTGAHVIGAMRMITSWGPMLKDCHENRIPSMDRQGKV